jgi:hypothetical protein
MTNIFVMLGGMLSFVALLALFDWIGRRQERASKRLR